MFTVAVRGRVATLKKALDLRVAAFMPLWSMATRKVEVRPLQSRHFLKSFNSHSLNTWPSNGGGSRRTFCANVRCIVYPNRQKVTFHIGRTCAINFQEEEITENRLRVVFSATKKTHIRVKWRVKLWNWQIGVGHLNHIVANGTVKKRFNKKSKWLKKSSLESLHTLWPVKKWKNKNWSLKRSPESHSSRLHGQIECQQATWKIFRILLLQGMSILLLQGMSWFNIRNKVCIVSSPEAMNNQPTNRSTFVMSVKVANQEYQSSSIHQVHMSPIYIQFHPFATIYMHVNQFTSIWNHITFWSDYIHLKTSFNFFKSYHVSSQFMLSHLQSYHHGVGQV